VIFLLKYHQNPPSPQETEHKKRERKIIEKQERKKEEEKEKLQESLQIKAKSIFREEKNISTSKISFLM
jgi:hypothetical protein